MPAISFRKQFKMLIVRGHKRQTVRAKRKRPIKKGQLLYLYYALRTKHSKLLRVEKCVEVKSIEIRNNLQIKLDCEYLNNKEIDIFAAKDGFDNAYQFLDFYRLTHGLPFYGQVIYW